MNGTFVFDPYSNLTGSDADSYRDDLLYFYDNVLQEANVPFVSTSIAEAYFDPVMPYLQHESMYWGWFTDRGTSTFFRDTDTQRIFFYNADYDGGFTIRNISDERWCGLALRTGYSSCAGAMRISESSLIAILNPPIARSSSCSAFLKSAIFITQLFLNLVPLVLLNS